jgi:WD40 repeat protein
VLQRDSHRSPNETALTAAAASPNGEWIAVATTSGGITFWDLTDPLKAKPVLVRDDKQEKELVQLGRGNAADRRLATRSLSFSADGKRLLSASDEGSVKIWSLDSGQRRWMLETRLADPHSAKINSVAYHPSRNDQFLTASDDGTARLWQSDDGAWEVVRTMRTAGGEPTPIVAAIFLSGRADDLGIITAGVDGAYLWKEDEAAPCAVIVSDGSPVDCVASSPDGRWIGVASGNSVAIYDAANLGPTASSSVVHSADITSITFSANGRRLFTASRDYAIKVWDTENLVCNRLGSSKPRELLTLQGHEDEVTSVSVAIIANEQLLISTGLDGQTILWPSKMPAH